MSESLVASILVLEDSDEDFDILCEGTGAAGVKQLIDRAAAIKTDTGLKEISLVVLTAVVNPKNVVFCDPAGFNVHHVKPVRHDRYLLLRHSLLNYRHSATLATTLVRVE